MPDVEPVATPTAGRRFAQSGRQTLLCEWSGEVDSPVEAYPYWISTSIVNDPPGKKTHLAPKETMMGDIGDTACGRWLVKAEPIESQVQALKAAQDLCRLCRRTLRKHELEMLAAMANANSQRTITPEDI